MKFRAAVVAAFASSILATCGGGGSADAPSEPSPPPTPPGPVATLTEGLYLGPNTTGTAGSNSILVLEGGETWVDKQADRPGETPLFVQGSVRLLQQTGSKSSTASGGVSADQTLVAGTFGTDAALVSNVPSMTLGTGPVSFTSDPTADGKSTFLTLTGQPKLHLATVQDDGYEYQKPASLADVAGSGDAYMTVNSAGAITSASALCNPTPECTSTGALTPRASGKNVFNVSVTVAGAACAAAGTYSGVAYQTGIRLHLFAINSEKTRVLNRQLDRYYICW